MSMFSEMEMAQDETLFAMEDEFGGEDCETDGGGDGGIRCREDDYADDWRWSAFS